MPPKTAVDFLSAAFYQPDKPAINPFSGNFLLGEHLLYPGILSAHMERCGRVRSQKKRVNTMENEIQTPSLEEKIGQLIVVGFHGVSPGEASVQRVMAQARAGEIGGVIVFGYNIQGPAQLKLLLDSLRQAASSYPLFTLVDQEGGRVQRLSPEKGFAGFSSAKKVAETMSVDQARLHYRQMAGVLRENGFNFDFAPCVDLDGDPGCDVIGGLERSYSDSVETVVDYARAMIEGLHDHGIFNCLKHYPGHGRARGDSHMGLVDISRTWTAVELTSYERLIKDGHVDAVMTAHLLHSGVDPDVPVTFSKKWIDRLRKEIGFNGVVIADDLHMGAILHHYPLEEIVTRGFGAGLDLLLFSNNPLAAKAQGIRHDGPMAVFGNAAVPDAELPAKILNTVVRSINSGALSKDVIDRAFGRVLSMKQRMGNGSVRKPI